LLYISRLSNYLFGLKIDYYHHHILLVNSLHAILTRGQSIQQLIEIERDFLRYIVQLYGERYVTLNIHLLSHLVRSVRMHGPLVCYSTFPFESYNGIIMRAIHGTYRVEQGICRTIPLYQHLQTRIKNVKNINSLKLLSKLQVCLISIFYLIFI